MTPRKKPEERARVNIDIALRGAGWLVQDYEERDLGAGRGVAVREFWMASDHGRADYLLFVDGQAVGILEAKPEGHTLSGVKPQIDKYAAGLPEGLNAPITPLPFLYTSTGVETQFVNLLDPKPRSRRVFRVARPETLAEWLAADTLDAWVKGLHAEGGGFHTAADDEKPSTLRARLQTLAPIDPGDAWTQLLYPNQIRAVNQLEGSLKEDHPRALVQMATGSGKTIFAITSVYRLIKYGGARRVLFLVDRSNLGEQAEKAFEGYRTPDDNRKFTELYNVQRLTTNTIGASTKVAITTIQRLYSMLKGEPDLEPEFEERSTFEAAPHKEPLPVVYSEIYPPEYFDVIVIDECHRSIYSLWRQVIEYFDAYLVGLTATPAKHTFGFFKQNLVMEYGHEEAVADGVNVDFDVYKIRTKITKEGATIEASGEEAPLVGYRNRATREIRWQRPDEDIDYKESELDRRVVAKDQIRLIIRTLKARLFTEIFPGRAHVPKTLIFAKDDSHAEDIVRIIREVFGEGDNFCQKITYKVTGVKPAELIQAFRNSYEPRVAVTVDMIATGTDIRPIEIVMFMRSVKSRVLWEQMKGRGVRIISPDELRAVTPDAKAKTHFVLVDCVGMTEAKLNETGPLDRKKSVPLDELLEGLCAGEPDPSALSSLASRLARLAKRLDAKGHARIKEASGGLSLSALIQRILKALDGDAQVERARMDNGLAAGEAPTEAQVEAATQALVREAVEALCALRALLMELAAALELGEQIIDEGSIDVLEYAGISEEAKAKAKALVTSFEAFIEEHKDEISALQFFYSVPHRKRLTYKDIKALAESIQAPPRSWTPEKLWRAYEVLDQSRVRGASTQRLLTDVVSLVRFALHEEAELVPYAEQVQRRFEAWVAQQANRGRSFTPEQVRWFKMIRDHVAASLEIDLDDFDYAPFAEEGGLGRAHQVFGRELGKLLKELNEVLAA